MNICCLGQGQIVVCELQATSDPLSHLNVLPRQMEKVNRVKIKRSFSLGGKVCWGLRYGLYLPFISPSLRHGLQEAQK